MVYDEWCLCCAVCGVRYNVDSMSCAACVIRSAVCDDDVRCAMSGVCGVR